MASNPNDMKKQLLSMRFDEITKKFFEDNFGNFMDEKSQKRMTAKYSLQDKIVLEANEYHNPVKITTTLGRLLTNKFLFDDGLIDILGYTNTPFTGKQLSALEEKIANAMIDGKIDIETMARYYDRVQWLGMTVHSIVCGSLTERTIGPLPEITKLKEELFKKYEEDLKGPNGVIFANEIEKILLEEAKKILDKDDGMDLYRSKAQGDFDNNYKNIFIIRGPVYNNVTKRFDFLKSCFSEGITRKEIPSYGSQVISGAYPKAVGTKVAGYYTKKFSAVYQSITLDDRTSDCGSKKYRKMVLTDENFKRVKYRWINDGGKLVCLTPEVAPKYFGKEIQLRSPLYCTSKKLCAKCAGDLPYRLGIKNIGLTVSDISSGLLNALMKAFHSAVVNIHEIKISEMFK